MHVDVLKQLSGNLLMHFLDLLFVFAQRVFPRSQFIEHEIELLKERTNAWIIIEHEVRCVVHKGVGMIYEL